MSEILDNDSFSKTVCVSIIHSSTIFIILSNFASSLYAISGTITTFTFAFLLILTTHFISGHSFHTNLTSSHSENIVFETIQYSDIISSINSHTSFRKSSRFSTGSETTAASAACNASIHFHDCNDHGFLHNEASLCHHNSSNHFSIFEVYVIGVYGNGSSLICSGFTFHL
ncbi:MAG TPA: hypothetical protein PKN54_00825 [Candidatus Cloacimonas acidaminovorans]|nr:hypothetical protein [Candidatus Cloacimonas acidaminovorans]